MHHPVRLLPAIAAASAAITATTQLMFTENYCLIQCYAISCGFSCVQLCKFLAMYNVLGELSFICEQNVGLNLHLWLLSFTELQTCVWHDLGRIVYRENMDANFSIPVSAASLNLEILHILGCGFCYSCARTSFFFLCCSCSALAHGKEPVSKSSAHLLKYIIKWIWWLVFTAALLWSVFLVISPLVFTGKY
jgi:hypothetical protein